MSTLSLRYLYCDGPLCIADGDRAVDVAPDSNVTASDLRRDMRRDGWHVNQPGGKDYCPECWATLHP